MKPALAARIALVAALIGAAPAPAGAAPREVRVGSKKFTESVILAEIARRLIEADAAGDHARHIAELGGTRILWNSLVGDALDAYPEYTGTITQELLRAPDGRERSPDSLRAELARAGLRMTASLGFSDSYALGMKEDVAERLGIRTISDLVAHRELLYGLSNEFRQRVDGWPRVRARYRITDDRVRGLDHDIGYRALESGDVDVIDLYSTDAEIPYYRLRVLEDDRGAFPRYDAVFLYRADLERRAPDAVAALGRLAGTINATTMARLNASAKLDHVPTAEIARQFLAEKLGVHGPDGEGAAPSVARDILHRLLEHLRLVCVSLGLAILASVPLGILAARNRHAGQFILGLASVIQTIPALALLVMLIRPLHWLGLPGIGDTPAIVALFLYSLLPIIRNTHAGLENLPPALRESAATLGLTRWTQLRLIELPLASPLILAGIRTAAVINVGFATLGALIGAGGFGQPILSGIRLDDYGLILQGAAPAAALAVATQGLFALAERWLVPRGLRLERGD